MPQPAYQDLPLFIHRDENRHDNRRHLEENREKFSQQCALVYSLLKMGKDGQ